MLMYLEGEKMKIDNELISANDSEVLKNILSSFETIYCYSELNSFVLDNNFRVLHCSDGCAKYMEFKLGLVFDNNNLSALNVEFNAKAVICGITNSMQDKLKRGITVYIKKFNISRLFTFYLYPVIANERVIAIVAIIVRYDHAKNVDEYFKRSFILKDKEFKQCSILQDLNTMKSLYNKNIIELSLLEESVIYLLLRNFSSADIATIMSKIENRKISNYSIDKIISDKLRVKFEAHSRVHLIKILTALGYRDVITEQIIKNYTHETIFDGIF